MLSIIAGVCAPSIQREPCHSGNGHALAHTPICCRHAHFLLRLQANLRGALFAVPRPALPAAAEAGGGLELCLADAATAAATADAMSGTLLQAVPTAAAASNLSPTASTATSHLHLSPASSPIPILSYVNSFCHASTVSRATEPPAAVVSLSSPSPTTAAATLYITIFFWFPFNKRIWNGGRLFTTSSKTRFCESFWIASDQKL